MLQTRLGPAERRGRPIVSLATTGALKHPLAYVQGADAHTDGAR
jgi:hypothetical protein